MSKLQSASIDNLEVEKFSRIADEWWDLGGKFAPLHKLNPVRVEYIRAKVEGRWGKGVSEANSSLNPLPLAPSPLKGISILDIGCGGGILSESMARLGAKVTGIDASEKNIKVASLHAQKSGLDIDYKCTSAEELAASGAQFDVVLNMEVIEHVADVASFMKACAALVKPGGVMFVATMNRTVKSFALAIVGAEYILRWLPRGTHNWEKLLKPSEINTHLEKNGMNLKEITGISFNPLKNEWHVSRDISVNYIMVAGKE